MLASIPDGWVICDGRSYRKSDGRTGYTPNLVGKFIYGGVGQFYSNVDTQTGTAGEYNGGNANNFGSTSMYAGINANDQHTTIGHSGGKYKVTLTTAQIPAHRHGFLGPQHPSGSGPEQNLGGNAEDRTNFYSRRNTDNTGGGQAHDNMPPYYTLAYIMKKY